MRAAWAAALLVAACGAGAKQVPPPESEAPKPLDDQGGADTEAYAAVSSFFNKRRPAVSQCYADALAVGKVNPKARGYVTVAMTVPPSGRPEKVHVAFSTLKSPMVEDCIAQLVSKWLVPKPSQRIEFSFSYNFLPE